MHVLAPSPRRVEKFDLTTRDGRTYRYPGPTRLDRLAAWLHSVAEPALLSTIVVAIVYLAGVVAESVPLASEACRSAETPPYRPSL
jgi:hypothetical protein